MGISYNRQEIADAIQRENKLSRNEQVIDLLETNHIDLVKLNTNVAKAENAITTLNGNIESSITELRSVGTLTNEQKSNLNATKNEICNAIIDTLNTKSEEYIRRIARQEDKVAISKSAFYCLIITLLSLFGFFVCIVFANSLIYQNAVLWKLIISFTALWGMTLLFAIYVEKKWLD